MTKFMKDFNGEKIFSLEYDKETLKDMVLDNQEEIERLNSIIKEVREHIEDIKGNYFKRYDDEVYKLCDDLLQILDKVGSDKE